MLPVYRWQVRWGEVTIRLRWDVLSTAGVHCAVRHGQCMYTLPSGNVACYCSRRPFPEILKISTFLTITTGDVPDNPVMFCQIWQKIAQKHIKKCQKYGLQTVIYQEFSLCWILHTPHEIALILTALGISREQEIPSELLHVRTSSCESIVFSTCVSQTSNSDVNMLIGARCIHSILQ